MKVAFLPGCFRPDRCGVSDYTAHLLEELSRRGVKCLVVTSHAAARHHSRPEVVGATASWGPRLLATLPRAIAGLGADVLHIQHAAGSYRFHRAIFALPPLLRATGWRRPIVVTVHEYGWWEWRPRLLGWAWRRLGPWGEAKGLWDREDLTLVTGADALIVTNRKAANVLAARLPGLAARTEQIPIGPNIRAQCSDVRLARSDLRARYGWDTQAPVIAYFGFLHPVKGLETLLAAFARVLSACPDARLLLIGGAESLALPGEEARRYRARLEERVQQAGLGGAVCLTGYLANDVVSGHLAGADVGVLPFNGGVTTKSGSLLAMWAHGLPVVATRPPLVETEVERAAHLVPCRDVAALAEALLGLLQSPSLRDGLAARARAAAAMFSWQAIGGRHLDLYERLLAGHAYARGDQSDPEVGGHAHAR